MRTGRQSPVDTLADVTVGSCRMLAGLLPLRRATPRRVRAMVRAVSDHGLTLAGLVAVAAARDPDAIALVDDEGAVSYGALDDSATAMATTLEDHLVDSGRLGVLCRSGRRFVVAAVAGCRLGADVVLLNTGFSAPALREVLDLEGVDLLVHDAEFSVLVSASGYAGATLAAAAGDAPPTPTPVAAPSAGDASRGRGRRRGRLIVLTAGTTGRPKGAQRDASLSSAIPVTTLFRRIPIRRGSPIAVLPPLFHGYGLGFLSLAFGLGCPALVRRRFDADEAVELIAEHRAETIVAVPTMLTRIVDRLGARRPPESVRVVVSGAGMLHPATCRRIIAAFGPSLFNLYGSTEEGWSTLATPADLAVAPGTIGRPAAGIRVEILDDDGRIAGVGEAGHLCVGSRLAFTGYTGGGGRRRLAGLLASGDLGHRDAAGRFFVDGRSDDMIVTGGENVFTTEVEDCLLAHHAVREARVEGEPDEELGFRLVAHVAVGEPVTIDELRHHVAAALAMFKVPRRYILHDDLLPTTETGKPQR